MWDIHSTTQLLKAMSASTEPDELLRLFMEHVRRRVHVERAVVLSNKGLTAPQYRVVLRVEWDDDARAGPVADPDQVRAGGLLAKILYSGDFQSIAELSPEASDPAFDLLRGSRSLMAFPLFDKGASIGMVVMFGPSPHTCNTTDLCGLAVMSALLERASSAQMLAQQLEATCRALDAELQAAANVQRWLLPPSMPKIANVSIAASYRTARHSGGDYYDVGQLPDGRTGVLIADVSGKGAAAAVLMAVLRTIVHVTGKWQVNGPAAALDHANDHLCALGLPDRGAFITAFCGALDPATGAFTYSSAGHDPPRLVRIRDRIITPLDGARTVPLGILDEPRRHLEETVVLMPGDLALFYTDGITEAASPEGEFFGIARLEEVLRTLPEPVTPALAVEAIARVVGEFAGAGLLSDDQTLLALGR